MSATPVYATPDPAPSGGPKGETPCVPDDNRLALTLEDGTCLRGRLGHPLGDKAARTLDLEGEVVFTTAMGGYPEAITDPSYADQILVLAFPQAGIYGVPAEAAESRRPTIRALVVDDLVTDPPPGVESLGGYLARHGVPVIAGIDTRALIRRLRTQGTVLGRLTLEAPAAPPRPESAPVPSPLAVTGVAPVPACVDADADPESPPLRMTIVDFGAKRALLKLFPDHAHVVIRVVGPDAAPEEIVRDADAVLLSNGPGDPATMTELLPTVRAVAEKRPTFGVCLGHQLLAEAFGARTYKLRYGHRGVNHPVLVLATGETWITSHNHGYAVDEASLSDDWVVTVRDLTDGTVEGIAHRTLPVVGLQFHPEGAPGPREADQAIWAFLSQVRRLVTAGGSGSTGGLAPLPPDAVASEGASQAEHPAWSTAKRARKARPSQRPLVPALGLGVHP